MIRQRVYTFLQNFNYMGPIYTHIYLQPSHTEQAEEWYLGEATSILSRFAGQTPPSMLTSLSDTWSTAVIKEKLEIQQPVSIMSSRLC